MKNPKTPASRPVRLRGGPDASGLPPNHQRRYPPAILEEVRMRDAVVLEARAYFDGRRAEPEVDVATVGERALRCVRHVEEGASDADLRAEVDVDVFGGLHSEEGVRVSDLKIGKHDFVLE